MIQHSLIVGEFPGKSLAERAIMAGQRRLCSINVLVHSHTIGYGYEYGSGAWLKQRDKVLWVSLAGNHGKFRW